MIAEASLRPVFQPVFQSVFQSVFQPVTGGAKAPEKS